MSSRHHSDTFDLDAIDLEGFARGVKALRGEIDASLGPDDLRHLRRIERWGRVATAVGLATAPIAPNPLSAAALALGRATRWLLMHHVGHRGYDKVPAVPPRFTARVSVSADGSHRRNSESLGLRDASVLAFSRVARKLDCTPHPPGRGHGFRG